MSKHEVIVNECIARLIGQSSTQPFEQMFGKLVAALWTRSSRNLSVVTLDAIFDRALYVTQQRFPIFASFQIRHEDARVPGFSNPELVTGKSQLTEACRYFLVTLLTLFGNLTADALVSGLYVELQTFSLHRSDVEPSSPGLTLMTATGQIRPEIFLNNEGNDSKSVKGVSGAKDMKDMKDNRVSLPRVMTHITNLDAILAGGLPKGSITIIAGPPGTGKTILSQQIGFSNATPETRVIYFQTLSEPTAKTLKYISQFKFFDPNKLEDGSVEFIDLGGILKTSGVKQAVEMIMDQVKRVQPAIVIIDSFKVFEDLTQSREELRKFSYEVAVNLMAWECTALLLGEFSTIELETNPLFSIVDGLIKLKLRREDFDDQRFVQVVKMRGTNHSRDDHVVAITDHGMGVYAPNVTIRREVELLKRGTEPTRGKLGISRMDELLGEGVPLGSSFIISGVAGTGKTILSLEFIYKGAKDFGERGIYFSFEETEDRLLAEARGMGWDMERLINSGMVEIVFIPQPDIMVEKHLLMMSDRIAKLKAKRIAIDSVSLFVSKITDSQIVREKIFQLATLVQKAQGIGFFATDIPYGGNRLSRFGVEETVVDGVILLTATENAYGRERFIEIYKLRNTAHMDGRHKMEISSHGINITPRGEKMVLHHQDPPRRQDGRKEKKSAKKAA